MLILLIAFILSLILGVVVRLTLLRDTSLKVRGRTVGGGVLIAGAALIILSSFALNDDIATLGWPAVDGQVVNSYVAGEREFHPVVVYRYRVDDNEHTDSTTLHAPGFGGKRRKYEVAIKSIVDYPPGSSVNVYYNPLQADQSILVHGIRWSPPVRVGFGIVLSALGLAMITAKKPSRA